MRFQPKRRRRGTLMIGVLACLIVVGSLIGLIAKDAVSARRETRIRLQMHQSQRLLDAGILRAAIQSKRNPDYRGETWQPQLSFARRDAAATVTISVDDDQTTVTAKLGTAPHITTQSHVYSSSEVQ
ncbi:hypothetical protein Enr13x_69100 [Stieleria neptunia]|uniref:General secretion pathway protein GspK n=1 Tax=Stieleria neptunia TaxID=2527979 RepID=A0A518I1P1_9BACT|nr:hypothetical protein [Stieleria neptunia]QDV47001.1 hypothetical protein Enr13x_69100 [Stieleria neptunia]